MWIHIDKQFNYKCYITEISLDDDPEWFEHVRTPQIKKTNDNTMALICLL
jgi:hypothetical protein